MTGYKPVDHERSRLSRKRILKLLEQRASRAVETKKNFRLRVFPHRSDKTTELIVRHHMGLFNVDMLSGFDASDCVLGMGRVIRRNEYGFDLMI
jgi:hypothetical protein